MTYRHASLAMLGLLAITGCPGDDASASGDTDTDASSSESGTSPTTTTATTADTSTSVTTADTSSSESESGTTPPESSSSEDSGPPPMPAEFLVHIENISANSVLPTSISAGLWIEQELGTEPVFTQDFPDRGEGLVALAEDGDPSELETSVMAVPEAVQWGTWPDAIGPGESTEFTFTADPGDRLSLLAGLGAGNDHFIGTGSVGVALFANNGSPMDERDISDVLRIWEVGSEYTQAPGQGGDQLATQAAAGDGMDESGNVQAFNTSTRALPQAAQVVTVDVTNDAKNPETLIITIHNVGGTVASDLSDLVWALHEDTVSVFSAGGAASDTAGLEELAEDGEAATLEATLTGITGVGMAATVTGVEAGGDFVITVTPDQDNRMLSFVTSIVASNDAIIAPVPGGIALLEEDGSARTNAQIEEDFVRNLVTWDVGTEANEVPGVGNNTQSEQALPDIGSVDPDDTIRPYSDALNDLGGPSAGGTFTVTVEAGAGPGELDITVENTSGGTSYPALFSPVLWASHDDSISAFTAGMPASASLEILAEDADPSGLLGDLEGDAGVAASGVDDMPLGTGSTFTFTVTPDSDAPNLSIIAMVIPSNDTFVAIDSLPLVDDAGELLDIAEIQDALDAAVGAWEAGTEANQAGAIGRDQYPRQAADNTGVNEGNGLVRSTEDDPIWAWPSADQLVLVTIAPTGN